MYENKYWDPLPASWTTKQKKHSKTIERKTTATQRTKHINPKNHPFTTQYTKTFKNNKNIILNPCDMSLDPTTMYTKEYVTMALKEHILTENYLLTTLFTKYHTEN
jgi:hypothetical protein